MTNIDNIFDFVEEKGMSVFDKFIAVLMLTGDDAASVKALWDLFERV